MYLYPEDVDTRLSWPLGTARRLARRRRLPHVVLPDGSIRFEWEQIAPLVRHVPTEAEDGKCPSEQTHPAGAG